MNFILLKFLISKFCKKIIYFINKIFPSSRYRTRYFNRFFLRTEKVSIIDIGSYGGYLDYWKRSDIKIKLSFDPIEDRKSSKKEMIFKSALWDKNKEINLYFTKGGGSDTLIHDFENLLLNKKKLELRVNPKPIENFIFNAGVTHTKKIYARTLDSILEEIQIKFDFLKIDAQGAEMKILKGCEKYLTSDDCLGLLIETYTIKMFKGQSLVSELSDYLKKFGFIPVLHYPSHGSYGCSNDTIFIKTGIKNPKLNTILKTYNLLRWADGYYENEIN